jgi:hypothetical protein
MRTFTACPILFIALCLVPESRAAEPVTLATVGSPREISPDEPGIKTFSLLASTAFASNFTIRIREPSQFFQIDQTNALPFGV